MQAKSVGTLQSLLHIAHIKTKMFMKTDIYELYSDI